MSPDFSANDLSKGKGKAYGGSWLAVARPEEMLSEEVAGGGKGAANWCVDRTPRIVVTGGAGFTGNRDIHAWRGKTMIDFKLLQPVHIKQAIVAGSLRNHVDYLSKGELCSDRELCRLTLICSLLKGQEKPRNLWVGLLTYTMSERQIMPPPPCSFRLRACPVISLGDTVIARCQNGPRSPSASKKGAFVALLEVGLAKSTY